MEQAAEFLLLCFLIIPAKTWKVNEGEAWRRFPGRYFKKQQIENMFDSRGGSTALKWRLWYDYDMHHDMMRKREVHSVISYIRGPLEEKREDSVVVEAGNIGYRIFIPSSVLGGASGSWGGSEDLHVFFRA